MLNHLKLAFKQVIASSRKTIDFTNIGYLPRWAILCFDTTILIVSLLLTKLIVTGIQDKVTIAFSFTSQDLLILAINTLCFIFFRTYAGLIRHSTFIDAAKFTLATVSNLSLLVAIHYGYYAATAEAIFFIPQLLIYTLVSFTNLFLFRLAVKQVFDVYQANYNTESKLNVFIYGTGPNAVAIANALKSEQFARYHLLGFIDHKGKNTSKEILGLPIINSKHKPALVLKRFNAHGLILADNQLTKDESLNIIDNCLEYKFKVFKEPLIRDVNDDSLTTVLQKIEIEDILEREPIQLDNKLVAKEIFNKIILVTGGAGSIGSEIVRQVANYKPSKLLILDQAESPLYDIQIEIKRDFPELQYEAIIADVRNVNVLEAIFEHHKPNVVYHAAAYKHVPLMEEHPSEAVLTNIVGSKNVADLAFRFKADKFVMVSTDKAVNPSNVMGASKRIAEIYIQALQQKVKNEKTSATHFVTTRFGNVLGSNGSVVPLFKQQIEEGGPLTITHPDIIRYFMTIPEACQLVLEAGAMGNGGEVFIFDMGKAVKILDLAKKIIRLAGFVPYKDIDIKVVGLRPGEKLYEELLSETSITLPTYNEKIMIAKVETYSHLEINKHIHELINIAKEEDKNAIVKKMKDIVPEFISMNSDYEIFDKKIV